MESSKDTHPAPSQRDDSKSEPDRKSKDVSTDPSSNRGDETDPKENPDNNSKFEQENDQGDETAPKFPEEIIMPTQNACGPSAPRVANCQGLSQMMCMWCRWLSEYISSPVPNRIENLSISLGPP